MNEDAGATVESSLWSVAVVGALLTLLSPLLFGALGVVSVGIGAGLAVANLWAVARTVRAFLGAASAGRRPPWLALAALKLVALFALLGLLVKNGWAEVLPLALGYLALPLGIVLSQFRTGAPVHEEG